MLTEMKGIVKDFGPVRAVDHVDITIHPGEVIGLLGENGAGKTTLMNVLAGTFPPDEGEIFIDGKKAEVTSALVAMKLGIRFIHQEISLCNDLRVFENMFLAEELVGTGGLLNKKEMIHRCAEIFNRMQVDIDPKLVSSRGWGEYHPALVNTGQEHVFDRLVNHLAFPISCKAFSSDK